MSYYHLISPTDGQPLQYRLSDPAYDHEMEPGEMPWKGTMPDCAVWSAAKQAPISDSSLFDAGGNPLPPPPPADVAAILKAAANNEALTPAQLTMAVAWISRQLQ